MERALLKASLADFAEAYWPVVTGSAYVPNAITTAIIAALQRVADGELSRLIINKPPGAGASTLLVLFQAWRIARDPSWRTMAASHSFDLSATASRRVRRLLQSVEFQARFPIALRDDAAQIALWETASGGHFVAVGRESNVTGRRCNELVCDDLNAASDRFSRADLDRTWAFLNETLSTRVDNDRSAMIVCAQRVAVDDVSGRLIEAGGWEVVSIPAEDSDGNPLAPNVLPRERLGAIKAQIGAAAYACQYLQHPASDDDAIVKRSWWRFHRPSHVPPTAPRPAGCDTAMPALETPTKFDRIVISVDPTFGSLKGDFAVAQVWGSVGGARYLLEQFRKKCSQLEQQGAIRSLAARWPGCKILVEKSAGGPGAIEQLTAAGIANIVAVPTGSKGKSERLGLVSPAIEGGHCYLPLGAPWLSDYVEELSGNSKHDDSADTTAMALADLATARATWGDAMKQIRLDQGRSSHKPHCERCAGLHPWELRDLVPRPGGSCETCDRAPPKCQHRWHDKSDGKGTRCMKCGKSPHELGL